MNIIKMGKKKFYEKVEPVLWTKCAKGSPYWDFFFSSFFFFFFAPLKCGNSYYAFDNFLIFRSIKAVDLGKRLAMEKFGLQKIG